METQNVTPEVDGFASHFARMKKIATAAGVIGGLAGLCISITYLMQTENPQIRGVIAMPFVCAFGLSAMITGITLLLAPSSFFTSDKGKDYLETIGTQSVFAARVVILVFLLLGCGFITVIALGVMQMVGVID